MGHLTQEFTFFDGDSDSGQTGAESPAFSPDQVVGLSPLFLLLPTKGKCL